MRTLLFFLLISATTFGQHVNHFTINTISGDDVLFYCYEIPYTWENDKRIFGPPTVSYDLSISKRDKVTYDIYLPANRIFEVMVYDPKIDIVKRIFIESNQANFPSNFTINCDFSAKEAMQVYADYSDKKYHVNLFLIPDK